VPIPVSTIRIPGAMRAWILRTVHHAGKDSRGRAITSSDVILAALQAFRTHHRNDTLNHSCETANELRRLARDASRP